MSDCIFCKIANHEIPSTIVFEDDDVVAFKDLNPQAPVHVLVVPKHHYDNIIDDVPASVLAAMVHAVGVVAHDTGIDRTGFRVIANTGDAAGQTVHHLHMHVLGGCDLGEGLVPAPTEEA
jgi:histidine triad (HIT) family protein